MKNTYFAILVLAGCACSHTLPAAGNEEAEGAAKVLADQVCSLCHGAGGHSAFPSTPSLAAQPRQYLLGKIKLFRNRGLGKPESHIDVLGLTLIDDPGADALARHFADQPPPAPVAGDAALIAEGGKIFAQGVPERGIAACSVCHRADGAGFWIFPRLAGQQSKYVERQLRLIQSQLRDSRVMHGIIKDLTAEEMQAIASFVQSK